MRSVNFVIFATTLVSFAGTAMAQTQEVAPEALRKEALTDTSTTVPDGWKVTAKVAGSFNLTDARNVVGATDGTAIQIGANVEVYGNYKSGQHTVENTLKIQEALTRTPPPDDDTPAPFIKSLDNLDLLSTYIYRFSDPDWLGPFFQFKLNTQIFPTTTEPTQDFRVTRIGTDGLPVAGDDPDLVRTAGSDSIDQTGSFEPLLLRETAGLFGRPWEEDIFTFDFKVGVGAQQIINRGGFTLINIDTSGDTPLYKLQELETTVDLGAELTLAGKGYILKDVLTWSAGVVTFLPVVASGDITKVDSNGDVVLDGNGNPEQLGTVERLNLEITGNLSLKLTKYLSLDWNLLIRRFPQVRDAFQIQNAFLLTLTMDLI